MGCPFSNHKTSTDRCEVGKLLITVRRISLTNQAKLFPFIPEVLELLFYFQIKVKTLIFFSDNKFIYFTIFYCSFHIGNECVYIELKTLQSVRQNKTPYKQIIL